MHLRAEVERGRGEQVTRASIPKARKKFGLKAMTVTWHLNPQGLPGVSNPQTPGTAVRQHRPEAARTQGEHDGGAGQKRAGSRSSRSPIRNVRGRGDARQEKQGRSNQSPIPDRALGRVRDDPCKRSETRAPAEPEFELGICPSAVRSGSNEFLFERGLRMRGRGDERDEYRTGKLELVKDESMEPRVGVRDNLSRSMEGNAQPMESDSEARGGRAGRVGFGRGGGFSSKGLELLRARQSISESNAHGIRKGFESAKLRADPDRDWCRDPSKSPKSKNAAEDQNVDQSLARGNIAGGQTGNVQRHTELSADGGLDFGNGANVVSHRSDQGRKRDEAANFEPKIDVPNRMKKESINSLQPSMQNISHGNTSMELVGVGMVLEPENPGNEGLCYVSDVKAGGPLDSCGKVQVMDRLWAVDGFRCFGSTRSEIRNHVMGR